MAPALADVLRAACPDWGAQTVARAEEKCRAAGVEDAAGLLAALPGLNARLVALGLKSFHTYTLSQFRRALEARAPPAVQAKADAGSPHDLSQLSGLGETALMSAVRHGRVAVVERLLAARADPNEADILGETPLMEAAASGVSALCSLLLEHRADPMVRSSAELRAEDLARDHAHLRALFAEARQGRGRRLLVAAAAHDGAAVAELLRDAAGEAEAVDADGCTALHLCAGRPPGPGGGASVARALLEARAAVDAANVLGETPLLLAARHAAPEATARGAQGRLDVVGALLERGASANASDSLLHETPLMEAALNGDADLARLLLDARADPQRRSASGRCARDFGAGHGDILRLLPAPPPPPAPRQSAQAAQAAQAAARAKAARGPQRPPAVKFQRAVFSLRPDAGAAPAPPQAAPRPAPPPAPVARPGGGATSAPAAARQQEPQRPQPQPPQPQPQRPQPQPQQPQPQQPQPQRPQPQPQRPPPQRPPPPQRATTEEMAARVQQMQAQFPGFFGQGLEIPAEAYEQQWDASELSLYCGSMGQLWPHRRPRPAGRKAPGGQAGRAPALPAAALRRHCEVLGLPVGLPAAAALKSAYRRLALRWHPDKNRTDASASETFLDITSSYNALMAAISG